VRHYVTGRVLSGSGSAEGVALVERKILALVLADRCVDYFTSKAVLDFANVPIRATERSSLLATVNELNEVADSLVDLSVGLRDEKDVGQLVTVQRIPFLDTDRGTTKRQSEVTFVNDVQRADTVLGMLPCIAVMRGKAKRANETGLGEHSAANLDQLPRTREILFEDIHVQRKVSDDLTATNNGGDDMESDGLI